MEHGTVEHGMPKVQYSILDHWASKFIYLSIFGFQWHAMSEWFFQWGSISDVCYLYAQQAAKLQLPMKCR